MRKVACTCLLAGCAIAAKSEPIEFHYFSPEPPARTVAHAGEPPCARLRLGRITPTAALQFRIAHRDSAVELGLYETLRWTERPDTYVRRSLSHALFEQQPLDQAVAGDAATLDIEVIAFEEVARRGRHAGRVQLGYALRDDRNVLARGVVTFERDARGAAIEQVVAAIGAALEAASGEVASRVRQTLCRTPPLAQGR